MYDLTGAIKTLQSGSIIAYPTETSYGLGADIYNEEALATLYKLKNRDSGKPISIMINNIKMLDDLVESIPFVCNKVIERLWPGPLTIVFDAKPSISKLITAGTGKVGIRYSNHPFVQALLEEYKHPITATSANISGEKSSYNVQNIKDYFGNDVFVIDGGNLEEKISTVIEIEGDRIHVLREGCIPKKYLLGEECGGFNPL